MKERNAYQDSNVFVFRFYDLLLAKLVIEEVIISLNLKYCILHDERWSKM